MIISNVKNYLLRASRAMPTYAGIGSRDTPEWALKLIEEASYHLASAGYVLHSGGAQGADTAFERGVRNWCFNQQKINRLCPEAYDDLVSKYLKVFIPWDKFNGRSVDVPGNILVDDKSLGQRLDYFVDHYHPASKQLTAAARRLMARNSFQVLSEDLETPVHFVLCYAKNSIMDTDGHVKNVNGGTGQAVRIAYDHDVQVVNIAHGKHLDKVLAFLDSAKVQAA